jgi:tetratricopeptide (TPR) repeat protein
MVLDEVGNVARIQGDWAHAARAYTKSLEISRQLIEQLGDTPEALRNLSISLNNVGIVARAQGDWAQAERVYTESLQIRRQLIERLGGTPEALRGLSVSLDNVGLVARAQGDWAQAERVYTESLEIRRQLIERLGGTPEALDDLAISLFNIGSLLDGDKEALREAEAIYAGLVERLPTVVRYREQLQKVREEMAAASPPAANDKPTG